ncbi:hypothetical protein ElyMa_006188400 [Elysia marginata]|uniref:Uncharacterized protein n=1 Tax=Elysia marginata TaxID=1093978 RepID=A0AAV4H2M8_9GAST|nr:hypothetical protein ElyMa_006188400 [Elysia marginata]
MVVAVVLSDNLLVSDSSTSFNEQCWTKLKPELDLPLHLFEPYYILLTSQQLQESHHLLQKLGIKRESYVTWFLVLLEEADNSQEYCQCIQVVTRDLPRSRHELRCKQVQQVLLFAKCLKVFS